MGLVVLDSFVSVLLYDLDCPRVNGKFFPKRSGFGFQFLFSNRFSHWIHANR